MNSLRGCGWPCYSDEERAAVDAVLRSGRVNYWTGDEGRRFEQEFADFHGVKHAIAVANGTVALELALVAVGVGPGDEVVVPSRTFIASASAVVMRGAKPVIADLDPHSQNLTAETVKAVLSDRTRAIVAVHLAGWPCDMEPIMNLARDHGLVVIEDCAQAHGATYRGRLVGSLGHINAFSFCQDKIMSTGGEGGMVTTDDPLLWERAWSFKDHGKSWAAVHRQDAPAAFRFLHERFGTNWRLTEMQSAIGRIQLRHLGDWVSSRRANAMTIMAGLSDIPGLVFHEAPEGFGHAYYRVYGFIDPARLAAGWNRDRIVTALAAAGVSSGCGSCGEIYLEKAFDGIRPTHALPVAHRLHETSLVFFVHHTLTAADLEHTVTATRRVLSEALAGTVRLQAA
jgi:dTDP-4-amino-4,6-dideoxygalactose transaminase